MQGMQGGMMIYFILAVVCAFIAGKIAENRGRDYRWWWFAGLFFGPLGVIAAMIASKDEHQIALDKGLRRCPQCAEYIQYTAKVCRFCSADLVARKQAEENGTEQEL